MCDGVQPSLSKDQPANNFVEVNVVIQRQLVSEAHISKEGDQVANDQEEA